MVVYPKLPVPSNKGQEPKVKGFNSSEGGGYSTKKIAIAAVLIAIIGGAAGYLLAPNSAKELAAAKKEAAAQQTAAKVEKDRADGIAKQVDVLTKDKTELEKQLSDMTAKAGEMEKKAEQANETAQKKLKNAIGGEETGTVSTEGEEIHLKLVDKVLFAVGDDNLTDKGKAVLDKVAKALKDIPDKQIWVQGHTDDSPIVVPPAPKKDPKKKGKDKEPDAPPFRFASNWELSAARALQVVHYLQDHAKLDPTKLAALAFGEYRPVSKNNKAANRRIEIVLYPHKAVIERDKKK
jgi:chemotaxis protein MotB